MSSVTLVWMVPCASLARAAAFSWTAFGSMFFTDSIRAGASARICSTMPGTFLACWTARSAVPARKYSGVGSVAALRMSSVMAMAMILPESLSAEGFGDPRRDRSVCGGAGGTDIDLGDAVGLLLV